MIETTILTLFYAFFFVRVTYNLKKLNSEFDNILQVLEEASSSGLALEAETDFPPLEVKWSTVQAIFFSSTVLTTIGV